MHTKFTRNLVLVFSLIGVSSCGADGSTTAVQTETVGSSNTPSDSTNTSTTNSQAQFTATLLNGAKFDSATVLQSQPLALWFWAPG